MERLLIEKMAGLCNQYYEPYDSMDRSPEVQKNRELEIKYNTYKDLLLILWGK